MKLPSPPASPRARRARSGRRLYWTLALALLGARTAAAQVPDSLEFLGFRPGMALVEIDSAAHRAGADSLRCVRSSADSLISECRASLPDADAGRTVDLWLSAVGDSSSILTLAAVLTPSRLDRWRDYLNARFGVAPPRTRGGITSCQWISDRRMLRLTWRAKGRSFEASVSMVDGRILDAWGNRKAVSGQH